MCIVEKGNVVEKREMREKKVRMGGGEISPLSFYPSFMIGR